MELEKSNELGEQSEFERINETRAPDNCDVIPAERGIHKGCENMDSPVKREIDSSDLRPEFFQYRDEGCELAGSCLSCPFINCIYDEPGGKQRWAKRLRDREIARLHIDEGKNMKELAEMFEVSVRTVQRVLKMVHHQPNLLPSREKEQERRGKNE